VEALSRRGSEGKPTELCMRTKPSSREEVASGSSQAVKSTMSARNARTAKIVRGIGVRS
jgi:hypothetical protein